MNDQEQPEHGTHPAATAGDEQQLTMVAHADDAVDEGLAEELLDEELGGDELSDDELSDADADELEDEDDDVEAVHEHVRSLVEDIFDDDDLGEVLSELDVLTLEDAAAYLKVEYGAIRRMIKEQGLPGRKIGDEWRFLRGAIADWLRAPGGVAPVSAPAAVTPTAVPERVERPAPPERREFTVKPPLRERFSQGEGQPNQGGSRYPQQGGARYPQEETRYPQENRPPRRPNQNEGGNQGGGGYQGGGQGAGNQGQGYQGGQGRGYQGGGYRQGGYQGGSGAGQGGTGQGGQGQGGYPPPRRPSYGNDQGQAAPQGEYRPPRRPYAGGQGAGSQGAGGQGGASDAQGGGNSAGAGSYGGTRFGGGPKKPKRKSLNEQRFDRLDRRKSGDEPQSDGPPDSGE